MLDPAAAVINKVSQKRTLGLVLADTLWGHEHNTWMSMGTDIKIKYKRYIYFYGHKEDGFTLSEAFDRAVLWPHSYLFLLRTPWLCALRSCVAVTLLLGFSLLTSLVVFRFYNMRMTRRSSYKGRGQPHTPFPSWWTYSPISQASIWIEPSRLSLALGSPPKNWWAVLGSWQLLSEPCRFDTWACLWWIVGSILEIGNRYWIKWRRDWEAGGHASSHVGGAWYCLRRYYRLSQHTSWPYSGCQRGSFAGWSHSCGVSFGVARDKKGRVEWHLSHGRQCVGRFPKVAWESLIYSKPTWPSWQNGWPA